MQETSLSTVIEIPELIPLFILTPLADVCFRINALEIVNSE